MCVLNRKDGVKMPKAAVKPNTVFEIKSISTITADEIQILTLLYQPLIGSQTISLFLTLYAMGAKPKGNTHTHDLLLQILKVSIEELLQWRYNLEAIGLLQTYVTENEEYVYLLKRPLQPKNFFNDGIINVFLNLKVGHSAYQKLKNCFITEESEIEGECISKNFNQIFDTTVLMRSNQIHQASPLPVSRGFKEGIELDDVFNRELLIALLKQKGLAEDTLSDKLFEQLNKFAFLYKLDEHELTRLVFDATDSDGFVNLDTFRQQAKQYFQFVNKGKPIELKESSPIQVQNPEMKNNETRESKEEKLLAFLSQNPIDFLKHKYHQKDPVPADRQLIEWLFIEQQMPHGVVNVLVDYVLKVSDGRLPKQLVEKIAGEWQRKEINTAEKAVAQVKKVLNAQKKRETEKKIPAAQTTYGKNKHVIRQEVVPDWLKNPQETSGKDSLSEEDLQKIEHMKQLQNQILNRKG